MAGLALGNIHQVHQQYLNIFLLFSLNFARSLFPFHGFNPNLMHRQNKRMG
jgi:hypothetical protein